MTINYFLGSFWNMGTKAAFTNNNVPLYEGLYSAFLEVDITGNTFEIPIHLINHVLNAKRNKYDNLAFSISKRHSTKCQKKSSNVILDIFENAGYSDQMISRVITTNGVEYYGSNGMIFNGKYEPLFLATAIVEYDAENNKINSIHSPKCRISYDVFKNCDGILEKMIVSKALKFYSTTKVPIIHYDTEYGTESVEIMIGDYSHMVVKPEIPTPLSVNDEDFNKIILAEYVK